MASSRWIYTALLVLCGHVTMACYQECSTIFNQKIRQLVGIRDPLVLTQRSCQAMSEQMRCLEEKKSKCDATSLQYINTILNFIMPDYTHTCARSQANTSNATSVTSPRQLLTDCTQKGNQCYITFNATYAPAVLQHVKNMTAVCQSLDNYTLCLEKLMPECGRFMGRAITSIRVMKQQHSYVCASGVSPQAMTECVNDTMECYAAFNATFLPAVNQYNMANMCSALDNYSSCLNTFHKRQECRRLTQEALAGVITLKRQYSLYCGSDGGQQAQKCVTDFQHCYDLFNTSYFPAIHRGRMNDICSAVKQYSDCVQPLYTDCGRHMAQALGSVRVLKEQYSVQCDPEFQKLSSCAPLMTCLKNFAMAYSPVPSSTSSSSSGLCASLSSYFPCVESSLQQCKISPEDTKVDFSQLGSLTGAYCQNLLGNRVLNTCPEFVRCTAGIVLVSSPDPSAMFDASTWCSYMDMSLSCVARAVNTPHCGLSNDDTIRGHLTQQRDMKRGICKLASVPPLPTDSDNTVPVDTSVEKGHHDPVDKPSAKAGKTTGGDNSWGIVTLPAMTTVVLTAVLSLLVNGFP